MACEEDLTPPQLTSLDSLDTIEPGVYTYTALAWICPDADTLFSFTGIDTLCVDGSFDQPFLPCDISVSGDTAWAQCVIEQNSFFPACQTTSNFAYQGNFNGSDWVFTGFIGNIEPEGTCLYYYECLAVTLTLTRIGDPPPPCGEPQPEPSVVTLVVDDGPGDGQVETRNVVSNFVTRDGATRVYVRALAEREDGYEYFVEFLTPPLKEVPRSIPATGDFTDDSNVGVQYADGRMQPFQSFIGQTITGSFRFLAVDMHSLAGSFDLVIDGEFRSSLGSEPQKRTVSGFFQVAEPNSRNRERERRDTSAVPGPWIDLTTSDSALQ